IVPPMKKLLWQMTSLFSMCGSLTAYQALTCPLINNIQGSEAFTMRGAIFSQSSSLICQLLPTMLRPQKLSLCII
ncbi:hypothetical protein AB7198_19700, partial [Providencia rettgeri]